MLLFQFFRGPAFEARLPAPRALERAAYDLTRTGFVLGAVAIFAGSVWAYFAWGRYWDWDPKEIAAAALVVYYAWVLQLRQVARASARPAMLATVLGLAVTLLVFLGANHLLPQGLHPYGR
jgi:ABC-type transport system involved in cytochrome c biogenesis permease subunit